MFKSAFLLSLVLSSVLFSVSSIAQVRPASPAPRSVAPTQPVVNEDAKSKKFVLDVVQMALAVPVADQQDRLRILDSAVGLLRPIAPQKVAPLVQEGAHIENDLISVGKTPVVSLMATGFADCKAAAEFVQRIYPTSVSAAEQSLIGALSRCPKEVSELVRGRLDAAVQQGVIAPRLLTQAMDIFGLKTAWTEDKFEKMFSGLPDPKSGKAEAPNFANMYAHVSPEISKDVARDSGVKLLVWIGKLDKGPERNLAANIALSSMREVLGEEGVRQALEREVMAKQAAEFANEPGQIEREEEESASTLQAMDNNGKDQSESLRALPVTKRAREAAAHGFASGTAGDKKSAEGYFDMAFSAADEVWAGRNTNARAEHASEIIEEVSEAAAQVDPITALKRVQSLQDSSARAFGMIAVARVVASGR